MIYKKFGVSNSRTLIKKFSKVTGYFHKNYLEISLFLFSNNFPKFIKNFQILFKFPEVKRS